MSATRPPGRLTRASSMTSWSARWSSAGPRRGTTCSAPSPRYVGRRAGVRRHPVRDGPAHPGRGPRHDRGRHRQPAQAPDGEPGPAGAGPRGRDCAGARDRGVAALRVPRVRARAHGACPVTVQDRDLAPGDKVLLMFGSANHDPRRFPDPEVFDADRGDRPPHIAFGFAVTAASASTWPGSNCASSPKNCSAGSPTTGWRRARRSICGPRWSGDRSRLRSSGRWLDASPNRSRDMPGLRAGQLARRCSRSELTIRASVVDGPGPDLAPEPLRLDEIRPGEVLSSEWPPSVSVIPTSSIPTAAGPRPRFPWSPATKARASSPRSARALTFAAGNRVVMSFSARLHRGLRCREATLRRCLRGTWRARPARVRATLGAAR